MEDQNFTLIQPPDLVLLLELTLSPTNISSCKSVQTTGALRYIFLAILAQGNRNMYIETTKDR